MGIGGAADRRRVEGQIVERRWRERIDRWKRSGWDERLFCKREKVGLCALRWWAARLGGQRRGCESPCVDQKTRSGAQRGGLEKNDSAVAGAALKWAQLSAEWETSGLGQAEFCRQRGVALHSLRWWRWRLARDSVRSAAPPMTADRVRPSRAISSPTFVPVQVIDAPRQRGSPGPPLEIVLRRSRRIRVSADFDARLLAHVVSVLEAIP